MYISRMMIDRVILKVKKMFNRNVGMGRIIMFSSFISMMGILRFFCVRDLMLFRIKVLFMLDIFLIGCVRFVFRDENLM